MAADSSAALTGVLSLDSVTAGYRAGVPIVHGVNHTFEPGTISLIIGPNGAGKSTLIKTIVGLTRIFEGTVRIDDAEITRRPTSDRIALGISFCPQGRANFPHMTVAENLRLAGHTLAREVLDERLRDVRQRRELVATRWKERIGNLSGGEQQRIELEMALMTRPKILLLDEPSLGLSPSAASQIFSEVREIAKSGVSTIVVEQNVRAVVPIADRLIVLEQGTTVLDGDPEHVMSDPDLRRVYVGAVGASEPDTARLVGSA